MTPSCLHIFQRKTDAHASQRGYNFQTLRTLQAWIENYILKANEDIYCEYEEDILHLNKKDKSVKFRQIKLYSSNFSFTSPEIKKAIVNFFFLHLKSDYQDFNKEFIFESNSSITKSYANNDAALLKEWNDNQDELSKSLIESLIHKSKEIIQEYIKSKEKQSEKKELIEKAIDVLSKIDNSFWEKFIKSIKWQFSDTNSENEFLNTKTEIEVLITQLPFYENANNLNHFFGILLEKVFFSSTRDNPDDRKLTSLELENLVLTEKGNDDKWYANNYRGYKEKAVITEFRIGEFFEILDLVNYCRRKEYLHRHKESWNSFLNYYIKNDSIDEHYKRKAIYERIFLNNEFYEVDFNNLDKRVRPKGSLKGYEEEIRFYFKDFDAFTNAKELHNSQILLNILLPIVIEKNVDITIEEFIVWTKSLYKRLKKRVSIEQNTNEKCRLLEQTASFLMVYSKTQPNDRKKFLFYYEQILDFVEYAPLYNIMQLGDRIDKNIKMHINIDPEDKEGIIRGLEDFSDKLFPFIEKREGKAKLAQKQVQRGVQYLESGTPEHILKALEYFHKAKENYSQQDTIEGYILALLNIAQLYSSLKMHLAAKYYALAAFRLCSNDEDIKRTETSLSILFHADFKQGSWFNALDIYNFYILLREQRNIELDEFLDEEGSTSIRFSFLLFVMSKISNQFSGLIDFVLSSLGYIGDDVIKPLIQKLTLEADSTEKINELIKNDIDDKILNDVGEYRHISFYAHGSLWRFIFKNNYESLSIAEEFISIFQIILSEITIYKSDLHLLKSDIHIELELSKSYKPPKELPSNDIIKWKVFVVESNESSLNKINYHNDRNAASIRIILNSISLLKFDEFKDQFNSFIEECSIISKQFSVNLFQKIHRDVYTKQNFDASQRNVFQSIDIDLNLTKDNSILKWDNSLSLKYNKQFSIEAINNRFENFKKATYLTIENLKQDPKFEPFINSLRKDGWKDWQIVSNIFNYIVRYKIRVIERQSLGTDVKDVEEYNKLLIKYKNTDEKECYIKFPLEAFETDEFNMLFDISFVSMLTTYGLEVKSSTPNYKAIRHFLEARFNLLEDDDTSNSPLRDIVNS